MEETFVPFRGIKNDLHKRLMCYKQDWTGGLNAGFRYIFLLQLCYKNTYFGGKDFDIHDIIYISMKIEAFLFY
jgi:hypothetical protein